MTDMNLNDAKKQPEKKIRAGPIAVAIWRNMTSDGARAFYTITFEKRFKDKEKEEWKSTKTLNKNDIPKAMVALQEAYRYLVLHKNAEEIITEGIEDEQIRLPKETYFEEEFETELEDETTELKDDSENEFEEECESAMEEEAEERGEEEE